MRRWGASALQWGHQVAKNSSSTTLPRYCERLTLWPCGVFRVNAGAKLSIGRRLGLLGGAAAEAGLFSISPTPGSVVGWKPTAVAAWISDFGAVRSEAAAWAAGATSGVVDRVASTTPTTTATIPTRAAVPNRMTLVCWLLGCCLPTGGGRARAGLLIAVLLVGRGFRREPGRGSSRGRRRRGGVARLLPRRARGAGTRRRR